MRKTNVVGLQAACDQMICRRCASLVHKRLAWFSATVWVTFCVLGLLATTTSLSASEGKRNPRSRFGLCAAGVTRN